MILLNLSTMFLYTIGCIIVMVFLFILGDGMRGRYQERSFFKRYQHRDIKNKSK